MDYKSLQEEKVKQIDDILRRCLPEPSGDQYRVMEDMAYGVLGGGKRLRPMLLQETCALFAEDVSVAEPFMAAVEMIHTYSLIHDDIMDGDDERRGRPTIHARYGTQLSDAMGPSEAKKFGETMGILAGDALLNYAFEIMAASAAAEFESAGGRGSLEAQEAMPEAAAADALRRGTAKVRAMSLIAKKAGIYGMVGGQVIDVQNTGVRMTAEQVKNINALKTSALIEASMMAGAILGGADEASVRKIERAASLIGQAFQIQDDILDVTGDEKELGKPIGSDDRNDKNTYVRLYGLDACRRMTRELSEQAISVLKECGFRQGADGFLTWLLLRLVNRSH